MDRRSYVLVSGDELCTDTDNWHTPAFTQLEGSRPRFLNFLVILRILALEPSPGSGVDI